MRLYIVLAYHPGCTVPHAFGPLRTKAHADTLAADIRHAAKNLTPEQLQIVELTTTDDLGMVHIRERI